MKTMRLKSSPLFYAPGMMKWFQAFEDKRKAGKIIREGWPGTTALAVKNILAGNFKVEGEDVIVEG